MTGIAQPIHRAAVVPTREFDIFLHVGGRGELRRDRPNPLPAEKIRCKLCDPVAYCTIGVKKKFGARSLADLIRLGITTGMARKSVLSPEPE